MAYVKAYDLGHGWLDSTLKIKNNAPIKKKRVYIEYRQGAVFNLSQTGLSYLENTF